ncbi:MAG: hypothetical protein JNJ57_21395 [Saprospiraceae bacterium]|nr:hypothetical protein [Saprospiraceae bacterium]
MSFTDFIAKFPAVTMPITLGETTHHVFGVENEPLSETEIETFILPVEQTEMDEFTEFIPCFSIADTENFIAVVWWKAELLNYKYTLATYTLKGGLIGHEEIAGMRVQEEKVFRSVAMINEEYEITIAEGESLDGDQLFDPTTSKTRYKEIMVNGEIV